MVKILFSLLVFAALTSCTVPDRAGNRAPTVDAGDDQTVPLTVGQVRLAGEASDPDGDALSTTWRQGGGPAEVVIADPTALETTATFSEAGAYTLELSASDGRLTARDEMTVTVEAEPAEGQGSWEELPESPLARQEVSYVQVGGKFYLAGGGAMDGSYGSVADHEVYDPVARTWEGLQPLPTALDHIQGVSLDGLIYYIGGLSGWPGPHADTVYIYDPETDSFSEGASMPRGRGAGGVAVHDGKIYYAGGLHTDDAGTDVVAWFDVYDPQTDTWTALPDMPRARDHFHAAVVDGVFYAIGGRQGTANATIPHVDAFDFETGTWTTLDTEIPTERGGFASAVLGEEILVIGGEGGGNTYDEVEAYNTRTNTWRTLEPMPTARHGIQAAVCNGGVYVAAGGTVQGIGPSTAHEVFFLGEQAACSLD